MPKINIFHVNISLANLKVCDYLVLKFDGRCICLSFKWVESIYIDPLLHELQSVLIDMNTTSTSISSFLYDATNKMNILEL